MFGAGKTVSARVGRPLKETSTQNNNIFKYFNKDSAASTLVRTHCAVPICESIFEDVTMNPKRKMKAKK
ncbi:hypothetical protein DPMN_009684 [Dreissena polymorpha]|uniref:Uncharacterized protein n=1 Tax=Dreissena polymorpha TaxID=45954 RepID=A0A9D4S0C2_DREPO|nr:hypothetical protein DPMN_009684 [Dreissena polymorpha]